METIRDTARLVKKRLCSITANGNVQASAGMISMKTGSIDELISSRGRRWALMR